jgi:uncharacterized alkaline shock family protein YloU
VEAAHPLPAELGRISISSDVIAQVVGHTAAECYGVVGMSGTGRVGRLLSRERPTQGVVVGRDGQAVTLDLHVVVEYGLNLAEVAATVHSRVTYEVERLTGLTVALLEVHIEDTRESQ